MFWIYDIPNWLFFIVCNSFFVLLSIIIFYTVQRFLLPRIQVTMESNDLLNYFIAAMGTFYSITIGLIAVGTWERYNEISTLANNESACIASLYRDFSYYPPSTAVELQTKLKEYTRYVIEDAWVEQRKGIIADGSMTRIDSIQEVLYRFQPQNSKDELIHAEGIKQFNNLLVLFQNRIANITEGLPSTLWLVIFTGALLLIFLFSLFVDENLKLQLVLVGSLGIIIGTAVFLIAAMDYPYRGEFSVSSETFEIVYQGLMAGK
jgi:hypothetical protein